MKPTKPLEPGKMTQSWTGADPLPPHDHLAIPQPRRSLKKPLGLAVAWLTVLTLLLTACGGEPALTVYLEANRDKLEQPKSNDNTPVKFVVEPGTPARTIAEDLQAAGLIDDALLFEAYVRVNGLADRLEAGTFTLSPSMTPIEIAEALQHALAPGVTITIREGWRLEQTADYLSQLGVLDGAEYRRLALNGDLSWLSEAEARRYNFLRFRPEGASLEGYLFPDSYELPAQDATATTLIRKQLNEFAERVMPIYWEAIAQGATTLELHQVLTLASIVEREAVVDAERPTIAGVYLNRLARGMKLEADPTVQYAMGYQPATGQWWKTPVSLEEYGQVDSPYNTYLYPGLPPGPIAAPGLASIKAVLYPEQHDYLYFVATPDGSGRHIFSRTYEEHLENVRRYRGQ